MVWLGYCYPCSHKTANYFYVFLKHTTMKVLFAMILLLLVIGMSSGIAFADVSVPKKIYQNQELLVTVTDAKSKYVTAVFYDLPMKTLKPNTSHHIKDLLPSPTPQKL